VFLGRLIQAAVSRQREFLADALVRAVHAQSRRDSPARSRKSGQYGYGSRLESEHAPDMCHMFLQPA